MDYKKKEFAPPTKPSVFDATRLLTFGCLHFDSLVINKVVKADICLKDEIITVRSQRGSVEKGNLQMSPSPARLQL